MPSVLSLLILPLTAAVLAVVTSWVPLKMAVPAVCALILMSRVLLAGRGGGPVLWFVVVALAFSAIGDYFLSSKEGRPTFFLLGIGLYLLAHVSYTAGAWQEGELNTAVLVVSLALLLPYFVALLRPVIPDPVLSIATLLYLLISCLAISVAAGLHWQGITKILFVGGIGLILVSDTAISMNEFLGVQRADWVVMPTYYLAHLSLTAALLLRAK